MRHVGTVLSVASCALFALSSCAAVRRALGRGDSSAAAFAAAATVLLAALLATVRAHGDQRAKPPEDATARRRRQGPLMAAPWALSSALTGMFAHRVAAVAPEPPFAALVWSMAGATVAGGFFFLFIAHGEAYHADTAVVVVGGRREEP